MWKSPLDDREVFVSCPKCGAKTSVTIATLRAAERVECPCRGPFDVGTGKLASSIQTVDQAIDNLRKALATVRLQASEIEDVSGRAEAAE